MESTSSGSRRNFLKTMVMAGSAAAINLRGLNALAADIPHKENYPIVVIGSGLGGLVSAAYLSKYGFKVTLLEQHGVPGGYATSFDRGKFTFDVSLHATVAEHGLPQMILKDLGVWEKMTMVHTPELRRIFTKDFDLTLPAKDPEGVKRVLSDTFPHETKGIHAFYTEMEQVIAQLWEGKKTVPSMMDILEKITLEQWMTRHVSDPGVKYCMAIFSGYYGLNPREINALFYAIATGEYLVHGGQYYKTRSQDLSDTLAAAIEKNKGNIFYNTLANKIEFDNTGAVRAVTTDKGTTLPARVVVANCSVPVLLNQMIPKNKIPSSFMDQATQRRTSLGSFVVWLGLNRELPHIKDYEIDIQDPQNGYDTLMQQSDPARSDIGLTLYDNLFKGYSAPGKSTLTIMSLCDYDHWKPFETDYLNDDKKAYNREKERIARAFIERVEQTLIPGLGDAIEVMEIGTPLTNLFYTKNPGGAIYGYDRNLPPLGSQTPIKGLYLASAWSHGGGYTPAMMAGRQAAKTILRDFSA